MAHKKKRVPPVPPANRPPDGPPSNQRDTEQDRPEHSTQGEGSFHEQDPKRRLGGFTGTGEQSYKQPGGLNDANH
jgi:hypothetical protein